MRTRALSFVSAIALLAMLSQLTGCAMSRSSSRAFASMASVWSLSKSFQSSFGGRKEANLEERYARDLAAVSATFPTSPADETAVVRDVTRVAEAHGITDWESLDATWLGIGVGLRDAGMSDPQAAAFVAQVFGNEGAARTVAALEAL